MGIRCFIPSETKPKNFSTVQHFQCLHYLSIRSLSRGLNSISDSLLVLCMVLMKDQYSSKTSSLISLLRIVRRNNNRKLESGEGNGSKWRENDGKNSLLLCDWKDGLFNSIFRKIWEEEVNIRPKTLLLNMLSMKQPWMLPRGSTRPNKE